MIPKVDDELRESVMRKAHQIIRDFERRNRCVIDPYAKDIVWQVHPATWNDMLLAYVFDQHEFWHDITTLLNFPVEKVSHVPEGKIRLVVIHLDDLPVFR